MMRDDYEPYWTLDMAHKDAVLMQAAAHHERLPVIDAVEALMRNVSARGLGRSISARSLRVKRAAETARPCAGASVSRSIVDAASEA